MSAPDPIEAAATLLRTASTADLLRHAFALTHRMHAARDLAVTGDLRAQRDLIEAEIIRRTTERA